MNIILLEPHTRFNNLMIFKNHQKEIYINNNDFFKNSFYEHTLCSLTDNKLLSDFDSFSFVNQSFLYLITETVAEYPYPYFSEKTWKAMIYKMPFMIVGAKNSLKQLREFGFKTFEDFWDESYDKLDNAADRIDLIVKNLDELSKLSQQNIDNLHKKMLPLLEHNQKFMEQFYYDQFNSVKKQLENL